MLNISNPRTTILEIANSYLGSPSVRYSSASNGLDPISGFDCSGFVLRVLFETKEIFPNLVVPNRIRNANEIFDHLGCSVDPEFALPGDLVFYTRSGKTPSHVAIFCGYTGAGERVEIGSEGIHGGSVKVREIIDKQILKRQNAHTIYNSTLIGYKRLVYKIDNHSRWPTRMI